MLLTLDNITMHTRWVYCVLSWIDRVDEIDYKAISPNNFAHQNVGPAFFLLYYLYWIIKKQQQK